MALPKLFVIGDSISIQYGPHLERMVQGRFEYARKTGEEPAMASAVMPQGHPDSAKAVHGSNGGDSRAVRAYVEAMAADPAWRPDVLLLNVGLHDIKHHLDTRSLQVPPDEYRRNLQIILATLASRGIAVLWVRTTPLEEARHNERSGPGMNIHRYEKDLRQYDAVALAVMKQSAVPVIDLHDFTLALGGELFADHVHFVESVRVQQAAFIAGYLAGAQEPRNRVPQLPASAEEEAG